MLLVPYISFICKFDVQNSQRVRHEHETVMYKWILRDSAVSSTAKVSRSSPSITYLACNQFYRRCRNQSDQMASFPYVRGIQKPIPGAILADKRDGNQRGVTWRNFLFFVKLKNLQQQNLLLTQQIGIFIFLQFTRAHKFSPQIFELLISL